MLVSSCRTRTAAHLTVVSLLLPIRNPSKPITTSATPSHHDIADLILRQRSPSQALETFHWASKLPSFRHTATTYSALLRSLVRFRRFDDARSVLADVIPSSTGSPPEDDAFVTFVRGLGRARKPREAIKVLDFMASQFGNRSPSLKIFNSILDVLVEDDIDLARSFYRKKMMPCGVLGDGHTFGILMKGLCRTNRIAEGFKLLQLAKSSGFGANPVIYNTLLHALCRNGKVGRARSLMAEMENPSDVTFNIMILAYCGEGDLVKALVMLEKCFDLGLVPDAISVTKIVDLLCKTGRVMEAVEVMERVEKKGSVLDVICYNTLIEGFCSAGKPKAGQRVVKEMELKGWILPNTCTYNVLISAYCIAGELEYAMDLFREMKMAGIDTDFDTFDAMIRGHCSVGRVEDGLKFLDMMVEEKGGAGDRIEPYNSIIYGFYKENRLEEANLFLERMRNTFPRAVDWSLKILGLCEESRISESQEVFDQMLGEGVVPSVLVYASLIDDLCKEGSLREAFDTMNEMVARGYRPVDSIYSALLGGFCRAGEVGSACKLLKEMGGRGCSPTAESYGIVIDAFCKEGDAQRACTLLAEMVGKDLVPNRFTWNGLLLCVIQEVPFPCKDVDGVLLSDHSVLERVSEN